jgi:hypothetical protein
MMTGTSSAHVDAVELEQKVKAMYREVAQNPHGEFHFEMGRVMAERLGACPRIGAVARESCFEADFSII